MIETIHDLVRSLHASPIRALSRCTYEDAIAIARMLPPDIAEEMATAWLMTAFESQIPPVDVPWNKWVHIGGRGSGKTRPICELTIRAGMHPQTCAGRIAIVSRTAADVRDTIVHGESGLLACADRLKVNLRHEPSNRRVVWPTGTIGITYSAEEPKQLRGPQHGGALCDEVSVWPTVDKEHAWTMLHDGLRIGPAPWTLAAMNPRPTPFVRALFRDESNVVVESSMLDNEKNLHPQYVADMKSRYDGTRIGLQELYGKVLDDAYAALFAPQTISRNRHNEPPAGGFERVVLAVDPAVSSGPESDETGIMISGRAMGHAWNIKDLSGRFPPDEWARLVAWAYDEYKVDCVIAEVNNGGDLVETILRTVKPGIAYKAIHAKRGKYLRAEPVAALYEQGKVHHLGLMTMLEQQMTEWTHDASFSPDRLDAMVYAITDLLLDDDTGPMPSAYARLAS